ncbi:dTDP-4-dehydrorhamnose 3,5-epimerase [Paenibacillus brevis]|uniref:dTDP-4-dehydrorhamnose 3,5-epimerase n=1 Tax=Paenibacillus brevis TaxID=2841508 RepID=A0ABS6FVJ2_9BACL|nr:dTDP-4-dehydrorhamnose 3,5-epimerase [Paenibacillus brevis]MBU5674073.1 dTDP-4-dehydrorhamnose 3,5-epimerase [Paenibacillus brevis]
MIIQPCKLQGVYEIILQPKQDHRGHFTRIYDQKIFQEHGLTGEWIQENRSFSAKKGTLRGLHLQHGIYAETKLVRAARGGIFDVFVDLRPGSPTYGQWDSILLTENNQRMVYIGKGFAHGFCTLTDDCEIVYKTDQPYAPQHEGGVIWNDESLRITWPILKPVISERDLSLPSLDEFKRIQQQKIKER